MREIAVPFRVDKTGGIAVVSDPVARAQQHLTTFVLTSPRERVMRPDFGSPIMRQLFEPITALGTNMLSADIGNAVAQYVSDVVLKTLAINPAPTGRPQDGVLGISLTFAVMSSPASTGVEATADITIGGAQ